MASKEPRGIRNNNPLNIVHSSARWHGMCTEQTDPNFVQFVEMVYGIRAACILIKTYSTKYHCNTIATIIRRWCPDNTADAYITRVCALTLFQPSQRIVWQNQSHVAMLLHAMAYVETGRDLPMHLFLNAWGLAFSNSLVD